MNKMIEPQDYLKYILLGIVSNPDDVGIERIQDSNGIFLKVILNPEDMGRVIGKNGKTITAIRLIMYTLGSKTDSRIAVKIIEPGKDNNDVTDAADAADASGEPEESEESEE